MKSQRSQNNNTKILIISRVTILTLLCSWMPIVSTLSAMPPPNFIEGRIFDSETGTGIQGAEIYIEIAEKYYDSTTTSEDGYYFLFLPWDLDDLMVRIKVIANSYYQTTWTGKVAYPLYVSLPLNSQEGLPALAATFSGKVSDANTGEPVEGDGIHFFLLPRLSPIRVNGKGEFRVQGLTPGFYFPILFKSGYRSWYYLFELEGGETEMFSIEMSHR